MPPSDRLAVLLVLLRGFRSHLLVGPVEQELVDPLEAELDKRLQHSRLGLHRPRAGDVDQQLVLRRPGISKPLQRVELQP